MNVTAMGRQHIQSRNYESRQQLTFEYGDMARGVGLDDEGISYQELDLDRGA